MTDCGIQLLNYVFPCRLHFSETARYFRTASEPVGCLSSDPITVPAEDWEELAGDGTEASPQIEYTILTPYLCDALLPHDCVIVHAVALRWREHAYLICARSGVGKSTQARFLRELRPGEFGVISGDRPILEFRHTACHTVCHSERSEGSASPVPTSPVGAAIGRPPEASVIVHPSPWNGKENWRGAPAAPLAGLILLERGEKNKLVTLRPREAALEMYPHFLQTGRDEKNLIRVAALETRMLSAIPIWRLTTQEAPASTKLLLEAVFS